jgi:hypothetical protein
VFVSIVAALGGYIAVRYLLGSNLSLPDSLAGAEWLSDPEAERFERYLPDEGNRYGIDAQEPCMAPRSARRSS